jgi:hypothetical protein
MLMLLLLQDERNATRTDEKSPWQCLLAAVLSPSSYQYETESDRTILAAVISI